MFKVNNKNTRMTFVNFEHISHLFLVFSLLTLIKQTLAGGILLVQSQQWKHQKNMWDLSQVNSKCTKMILLTCISNNGKAGFEQVKAGWEESRGTTSNS